LGILSSKSKCNNQQKHVSSMNNYLILSKNVENYGYKLKPSILFFENHSYEPMIFTL
jgi:hypothetical protein